MSTDITTRQTLTQSREWDWAVGGAVLGLTAALIQILAMRRRGEGEEGGCGRDGETRIDFNEKTWENNVDDLKSAHPSNGIINNAVFDTIEEEYHKSQYTKNKKHHPEYSEQTGKYDLHNLNQDFHIVENNS
jgi:hypothetical protein